MVTSSKTHAWIGFLSFYLPFFSILTLLSLGITSKANQLHLNPCLRLYLSWEPKIRHLISGVDLESRHPEKDSGTESLASQTLALSVESVEGDNPWPDSASLTLLLVDDWDEL